MKETIRKLIEYFCLIKKYRKAYKNYYFKSEDCVERSKRYSKEVMKKEYQKLYESLLSK